MKTKFTILLLSLSASFAVADHAPSEIDNDSIWRRPSQLVEDLTPLVMFNPVMSRAAGYHVEHPPEGPMVLVTYPSQFNYGNQLIFLLNKPGITATHYAVTGEVSYENIAAGTHLGLQSVFGDPDKGTDSFSPFEPIESTSGFRPFILRYVANDVNGITYPQNKLVRLNLWMTVIRSDIPTAKKYGNERISFRCLKLVQYPDAPVFNPPAQADAPTQPASDMSGPAATVPPEHLDGQSLTAAYLQAQEYMAKLKAQLDRYAPNHPKAIELNAQIQQQQAFIESLQADLKDRESSSFDPKSFLLGNAAPVEGEVVAELSQDAAHGVAPASGEQDTLQILSSALTVPFWDIHDPKITANRYAVIGEIRYDDVSNGYLEMWSAFAPESPGGVKNSFYTRTTAENGPLALLKGTSGWRPFWLPFDSRKITTRLTRIGITSRLADRGSVYVRNVKLVQYPGGVFPKAFAPSNAIPPPQLPSGEYAFQEQKVRTPVTAAEPELFPGIDRKSFLLGMATTVIVVLFASGLAFLSRRLRQRRKESELRRIASLDG